MSATSKAAKDNTVVSVLMPCYNAADTVDDAVDSILKQSFGNFELIVVDDGSTDSTGDRLQDWASKDPRVRVLSLSHAGIIEALNAGLVACTTGLIARMDADDRAHPERLAKQVDFLTRHPKIAVAGSYVEAFSPDLVQEGFKRYVEWLNSLDTPELIARDIFVESPLAHPSAMIRADWLQRAGGYQEHGWPEDYDLWLRLHVSGAQFGKVPEVLLEWRERPERLTRTDGRYSVENFLRAKAHYLCQGPLADREAVIIWGAGQMGRRISKHLERGGAKLVAFVDIDPKKIGSVKRGLPIISADDLPDMLKQYRNPVALAAVGSRGARELIRERLIEMGLVETEDFWAVA
jgi:cellulose synthase/poly-beta-1,6-N-acetylglucosamine synthase-like glycosyltransferase